MAVNPQDLWPSDIVSPAPLQTPLSILREQASILNHKTSNLIEAKVGFSSDEMAAIARAMISLGGATRNSDFELFFNLVAPALSGYTYRLFQVRYPIEIYPLVVLFDDKQIKADSEEEFVEVLKFIFADEKTKRIIQSLLAQGRS